MVLEVADDTVVNWVATRFGHTDLVTKIFFHSRPLVRDFVRPSPWAGFTKIIQKISLEPVVCQRPKYMAKAEVFYYLAFGF